MERENQRIAVTRRMLKEGLLHLLETTELEQIRVTELCRVSGVNRATFYRHYTQPENILEEMERELGKGLEAFSALPTQISEAEQYLTAFCTFLMENAPLMRVLIRCKTETVVTNHLEKVCCCIVESMAKERPFSCPKGPCLQMVSTFLTGGVSFLLRQWIQSDHPKQPQELVGVIMELIQREQKFRSIGALTEEQNTWNRQKETAVQE